MKREGTHHYFYQNGKFSSSLRNNQTCRIIQVPDMPLAQKKSNTTLDTNLLAIESGGSVLMTDSHNKTELRAFTAYGYETSILSSNTDLGFNAERLDPWSESYILGNGYRAFSPILMRFLCPDSLSPFDEGGINGYTYCAGDPINRFDPSGHMLLGKAYQLSINKALNTTSTPPKPVRHLWRERLRLQKDLAILKPAQLEKNINRLVSFSLNNPGKLKEAHELTRDLQATERTAKTKTWSDKLNFRHHVEAKQSKGRLQHLYNSTPGLEEMRELSSRAEITQEKASEIQSSINLLSHEISQSLRTSA